MLFVFKEFPGLFKLNLLLSKIFKEAFPELVTW